MSNSSSDVVEGWQIALAGLIVIGLIILAISFIAWVIVALSQSSTSFCDVVGDLNARIEAGSDAKDAAESFLDSTPEPLVDELPQGHQTVAKTLIIAARNVLEAIISTLIPRPIDAAVKAFIGTIEDVNREVCGDS